MLFWEDNKRIWLSNHLRDIPNHMEWRPKVILTKFCTIAIDVITAGITRFGCAQILKLIFVELNEFSDAPKVSSQPRVSLAHCIFKPVLCSSRLMVPFTQCGYRYLALHFNAVSSIRVSENGGLEMQTVSGY